MKRRYEILAIWYIRSEYDIQFTVTLEYYAGFFDWLFRQKSEDKYYKRVVGVSTFRDINVGGQIVSSTHSRDMHDFLLDAIVQSRKP